MISGFLITRLLVEEQQSSKTISLSNFYMRRASRIFPAALVFVMVAAIFYWREIGTFHLAAAFFYLANFDAARPWIFGHLWSLGVEEQFYLIWPSVLKKWYVHRIGLLLAVILLTPVVQAALYFLKMPGGNVGAYPWAASNLAFGCLVAILLPRLPRISALPALVMVIAIVVIPLFAANTASKTLFMTFCLQPVFYASLSGILLHVIAHPYRLLNWGPVVWLGKVSYSLYLWQQPFCADPGLQHGYFVLFALAAAALSYYFVERPVLRWRDRRKGMESERAAVALP